ASGRISFWPSRCSSLKNWLGSRRLTSVRRHSSSVLLGAGTFSYCASALSRRSCSQRGSPWSWSRGSLVMALSADRALHLELDQAVELDRVLERKLLGERLDEAVDDHRLGLGAGDAAAHQIEELLVAHLAHRRLVAEGHVLGVDVVVGVRVAS